MIFEILYKPDAKNTSKILYLFIFLYHDYICCRSFNHYGFIVYSGKQIFLQFLIWSTFHKVRSIYFVETLYLKSIFLQEIKNFSFKSPIFEFITNNEWIFRPTIVYFFKNVMQICFPGTMITQQIVCMWEISRQ